MLQARQVLSWLSVPSAVLEGAGATAHALDNLLLALTLDPGVPFPGKRLSFQGWRSDIKQGKRWLEGMHVSPRAFASLLPA